MLQSLLDYARSHVPFHNRRAPPCHPEIEHWPLMTRNDIAAYPLDKCNDLLSDIRHPGGYIIASGGTTAKPTYQYYAFEEFAAMSGNIAKCLMANGLESSDKVVNYFDSGQLWSAFLLADKALSSLPVTAFSVGYTLDMHKTAQIFERFHPNVIMGIPSMILTLARFYEAQGNNIHIQKVFYGGESMTSEAEKALESIWGCEMVRSAGYAATDVGTIGWQCKHCEPGEHHVFDDCVVEIIDDEIVVTSLIRRTMPIIRYRTGDRGEWVQSRCDCGLGAPLLKLLGRIDTVIIIWGCWILYEEIISAFEALGVGFTALQIIVSSTGARDTMSIQFETLLRADSISESNLRDKVFGTCGGGDLKDIFTRDMLDNHLFFENVTIGTLKRNHRTGKVIPILDLRS